MKFHRIAVLTGALTASVALTACSKDDKGGDKKPSADANPNGGAPTKPVVDPDDAAARKDDYQGIYQVTSHTLTPYKKCDELSSDVDSVFNSFDDETPPYFKLDTYWEVTLDPQTAKLDLWLHDCSSESECGPMVTNFLFPEKVGSVWSGPTSKGIGESHFEPGKCSFSYTERSATLEGKDIVIVTTSYSGDVAPLEGGCVVADHPDPNAYYEAYRGKVECDGIEVVTGTKLDLPMPK